MSERQDWDVIGFFVDETVASFDEGLKQRQQKIASTLEYARLLASYVVRALANTRYPQANAAWEALAAERERRKDSR